MGIFAQLTRGRPTAPPPFSLFEQPSTTSEQVSSAPVGTDPETEGMIPGTDTPIPEWAKQLIRQNTPEAPLPGAPAAGEIPPWVDMAALRNAAGDSPYEKPKEDEGLPTPWGFAKNVAGDVGQFATGLASLVGIGAGDVYNLLGAGKDVLTGNEDAERDFRTDDFLKQMLYDPEIARKEGVREAIAPAIQEDLAARYGSLGKFAKGAYNDPLFLLADIGAAGSLAGKGVEASARAALPGVSDELAKVGALENQLLKTSLSTTDMAGINEVAENVRTAMSNLSPQAARVKRTLPGAGRGTLNLTPEESLFSGLPENYTIPEGGLKTTLGGPGGKLAPVFSPQTANPFKRWVQEKASTPLTNPVERLRADRIPETDRAALASLADEGQPVRTAQQFASEGLNQRRVAEAAERYGVKRVDKPWVANIKAKSIFDKISGNFVTRYYGERDLMNDRIAKRITRGVENIVKEQGLTGQAAKRQADVITEHLHKELMLDTPPTPGRQDVSMWDALRAEKGKLTPETREVLEKTFGPRFDPNTMSVRIESNAALRAALGELPPGTVMNVVQASPDGKQFATADVVVGGQTLRLKFLNEDGMETAGVIDDLFSHLDDVRTKRDLYRSSHDAQLRALVEKLDAEEAALLREIEDMTEHAVAGIRRDFNNPAHAKSEILAGLRVDRHTDVIAPALKRKRFWDNEADVSNFRDLRERQYLPIKLELMLTKGIRVKNILEQISDVSKKQDARSVAKLAELRRDLQELGMENEKVALQELMQMKGDKRLILDQARDLPSSARAYEQTAELADLDLWTKLDAEYNTAGRMSPIYFPHMDPMMANPQDMLFKKAAIQFERMKDTSRFKRAMGWLYVNDAYIKNPIEAYTRAGAQVRKYIAMSEFYDEVVRQFGREILHVDEMSTAEKLMAPDLFNKNLQSKTQIEMTVMRNVMEGMEEGKAFSEGLREAFSELEMDESFDMDAFVLEMEKVFGGAEQAQAAMKTAHSVGPGADESIANIRAAMEAAGHKAPKMYAVPKVVAERMEQLGKYQLGWKARVFWDSPMGVWKAAVLAFSPRWIFYNLLGNITFLKMQGGSLMDVARIMGGKVARSKRFGNEMFSTPFLSKMDALLNRLKEVNPGLYDNLNGGFFSEVDAKVRHLGEAEIHASGQLIAETRKTRTYKMFEHGAQRMRRLNEMIESSFREAAYLTAVERQAIKQGVTGVSRTFLRSADQLETLVNNGMDNFTAVKALDEVNYFFNDYRKLSPIERNLVKRFIMPFYSFYKHIVKLLVTFPFTHPGRALVMREMGELSREMSEEYGAMPDWLVGSVPIGEGAVEGETRFLNTRGANPFNALNNMWESLGTSIAPQWKMLFEQITGKSLLTGKPFTSPDTVTPFGSDQAYSIDPQTGDVDPTTVRPDLMYHLASSVPQFKLGLDAISHITGEGTGARYGTGEMIIDQATGKPKFPDNFTVNLASLGGLSQTDFALGEFQTRQAEEERMALIEWLRRSGYLAPTEDAA